MVERRLEDLRLGDFLVERRLEDLRLDERRLGDLRLGDLRLDERRLGDLRLGDLRLDERRLLLQDFLPLVPVPLHAIIASFNEGRLPSRCLLFLLHDIILLFQERSAGESRLDDRRLVERRLGE